MRTLLRHTFIALLMLAGTLVGTAGVAQAAEINTADESSFLAALNEERAERGLPALQVYGPARTAARDWSFSMAAAGSISHAPDLTTGAPSNWQKIGENVGVGGTVPSLMAAFMASPGHAANILDPAFTHIGVGSVREGNIIYTTHRFLAIPDSSPPANLAFVEPAPAPAAPVNANGRSTLHLRNSNTSGVADYQFVYGTPSDRLVFGDWDGNGTETVGIVRGQEIHLRNSNTGGPADITFTLGAKGDEIIFGDWDGNGTDTAGFVRGREFHLRNSNSSGPAHMQFTYGKVGDRVVFGDWDGNGTDTVGVVRGRTYFLNNQNRGGAADYQFVYGREGDVTTFGDWDGNGTDTVGVLRGREVHLRNSNTGGVADYFLVYGKITDTLIFGDWDGNGTDTVGLIR